MEQKNSTLYKTQREIIAGNGLNHFFWTVVEELQGSLIVKNRFTGEIRVIPK